MALSIKSSGNGVAGSAAFSGSWVAGDLILLVLENSASNAIPATPTGYTSIASGQDSTNGLGMRVVYKYAAGSDTMPSFTDTTTVAWAIYGGVDGTTPLVQVAGQAGTTSTISASGITSFQNPANDWVIVVAVAKGITGNVGSHPFDSLSSRTEYKSGSDNNVIFDSNTPLSSYSFNSKTLDAAVPWITKTLELVYTPGGTPANASRAAKVEGIADKDYSRESKATLPTTDARLATLYSSGEVTDVATDNATRVQIYGSNAYLIHLFKDRNDNATDTITVEWNGQSTVAPSAKTVYLQVYNQTDDAWETLDSDSATAANTDFTLNGNIAANLAEYYDTYNRVNFRVYQSLT